MFFVERPQIYLAQYIMENVSCETTSTDYTTYPLVQGEWQTVWDQRSLVLDSEAKLIDIF